MCIERYHYRECRCDKPSYFRIDPKILCNLPTREFPGCPRLTHPASYDLDKCAKHKAQEEKEKRDEQKRKDDEYKKKWKKDGFKPVVESSKSSSSRRRR